MNELTRILENAERGDEGASERLAALVYDELREMARREMRGERRDHTLQPTALVNEAYLRLLGDEGTSFENRAHFFGAAASAIRRVLVEHARRRSRLKRGGGRERIDLDEALDAADPIRDDRLLALDEAMERLASFDEAKARLVELRFFAGMTVPEIARARRVSESTVAREWRLARSWLQGALDEEPPDGP
ncbi:MAG: sigma-70 family RNA polymerase sigma factor [Planctomycetota bacterium JB042]